jgi:hypothetical protein
MKLNKVLVFGVLGLAGIILAIFLLDLTIKVPFGRGEMWTDIFVVLACGLILWQGIETMLEFRTKKK